jgi:riboflavin biosynthesis pyrimidine reductase
VRTLDQISDAELAEIYAYPPSGNGPFVRANVIATLDGSAVGSDGRSGSINDTADARVFALLRGLADVVLVGAGTARAEGYRAAITHPRWRALRSALGLTPHPALAVVSGSLDLPDALSSPPAPTRSAMVGSLSGGLAEGPPEAGPVLVITTENADPARVARLTKRLGPVAVLRVGHGQVDVGAALDLLGTCGLRRVLLEGGPQLLGKVSQAGRLDELCLTLSPVLVAGDGPRVTGGPWMWHELRLAQAIASGGSLLTRWVKPCLDRPA